MHQRRVRIYVEYLGMYGCMGVWVLCVRYARWELARRRAVCLERNLENLHEHAG